MSQPRGSFSAGRSSEVERIIAAAEVDTTFAGKKNIRYRGRRSTWPGALALMLIFAGSVFGLVYYGIKVHDNVQSAATSDASIRERFGTGTVITDGRDVNVTAEDIDVVNPESYVDKKCEQPNFVSKNGRLFAAFKGGKEVQLDIKGINWMGMQDQKGVPKGLWDNSREGSTLYRVGQFLAGNNFNVVRLPLSIDAAFRNVEVVRSLINTNSQRALTATRYNKLLGQIIQGLGQFGLGIVLDFHVLSALSKTDDSSLWYGESIQINDIKSTITTLATELCNSKHFNVIGIDLKDGVGKTATWGDGSETDWAAAATELGNHLLTACPKWVAFIQGIQGESRIDSFGNRKLKNKFFAGSDLSNVAQSPIKLTTADKIVYSPKYWSSSFLPLPYFFDDGIPKGDMLDDYKESSDDTLRQNVETSMKNMFGPAMESGAAVVLSSFGGLMGTEDLTKMKTSTRIIQVALEQMLSTSKGLAGGFWYTLNPETYWPYPAPDNSNATNSGLVDTSWRTANQNVLKNLKKMDTMASVQTIPCVTA